MAVPPNDRCIDSVTLEPFVKVDGDNTEANFDYNNQGVCGSRSDRRAVWYEINGAGKEVTVNVCTNNEQLTDFGVFRACNTQNCLGAPPQQFVVANCDDEESNEYVFFGNEGESYYIHVRSDVVFEGVGTKVSLFDWYTIQFCDLHLVTVVSERIMVISRCPNLLTLAYNMVHGAYRSADGSTRRT